MYSFKPFIRIGFIGNKHTIDINQTKFIKRKYMHIAVFSYQFVKVLCVSK